MTPFLNSVLAQLSAVTDEQILAAEPKQLPCKHATVVGVLDRDHQALYALMRLNHQRYEELCATPMSDLSAQDQRALAVSAFHLKKQIEALLALFWVSCAESFPDIQDKPEHPIFAGWQLCWADHAQAFRDEVENGSLPGMRVIVVH